MTGAGPDRGDLVYDIFLVVGSVLAVLAAVAISTAWIEGRRPRVAAVVLVICGLVWLGAAQMAGSGFHAADIPNAFVQLTAKVLQWAPW